jgi:hypothetical protein
MKFTKHEQKEILSIAKRERKLERKKEKERKKGRERKKTKEERKKERRRLTVALHLSYHSAISAAIQVVRVLDWRRITIQPAHVDRSHDTIAGQRRTIEGMGGNTMASN